MDLGLDESQQMLKTSARAFLDSECPDTYVRDMEEDERGYTPEMWGQLAEQGWLGLMFPESYGGVGLSFLDLTILLEETGRALLPGPFFSSVVMGGMAIMDAGSDAQKSELLSAIAEGRLIISLALTEPSARWDAAGVQTTAQAHCRRIRARRHQALRPQRPRLGLPGRGRPDRRGRARRHPLRHAIQGRRHQPDAAEDHSLRPPVGGRVRRPRGAELPGAGGGQRRVGHHRERLSAGARSASAPRWSAGPSRSWT